MRSAKNPFGHHGALLLPACIRGIITQRAPALDLGLLVKPTSARPRRTMAEGAQRHARPLPLSGIVCGESFKGDVRASPFLSWTLAAACSAGFWNGKPYRHNRHEGSTPSPLKTLSNQPWQAELLHLDVSVTNDITVHAKDARRLSSTRRPTRHSRGSKQQASPGQLQWPTDVHYSRSGFRRVDNLHAGTPRRFQGDCRYFFLCGSGTHCVTTSSPPLSIKTPRREQRHCRLSLLPNATMPVGYDERPDEELPLLGQRKPPTGFASRLSKHLTVDVSRDWADVVLILCYFSTGLLDSSSISVWGSFVSMQTGTTPDHRERLC